MILCSALLSLSLLAPAPQGDPAADLKSAEFDVRLAAVEQLATSDQEDADKLLLGALKDRDWEIVERATLALGQRKTAKAFDPLVKQALEAPIRRLRRTAAEALLLIDAEEAYAKLGKKATGKLADRAAEALSSLAVGLESTEKPVSLRALEKALKSKEAPARAAAAHALVLLDREERAMRLRTLLEHEDVGVRAGALEGALAALDPSTADVLLDVLAAERVPDVVERRAILAYTSLTAADPGPGRLDFAAAVRPRITETTSEGARARYARLLGRVGETRFVTSADGTREPMEPLVDVAESLAYLEPALKSTEPATRAAAAYALGRVAGAGSLGRALALAKHDEHPRVRLVAMEAFRHGKGDSDADVVELLINRLADDDHSRIREMAAVYLAQKENPKVLAPLVDALGDKDWNVQVCAAVSLGKTRLEGAAGPLMRHFSSAADWRQRGAALVGMSRVGQKSVIPLVIEALDDPEPIVSRTAWEYLVTLAKRRLDRERPVWEAWWAENGKRVRLLDPEEEKRRRARFGYAGSGSTSEMYKGLDVLIFESRGDHIQNVLDGLGVQFRLTRQSNVLADEPYPGGVFVSNCTGEMSADDIHALAWFVRVGGYLFGSCWAVEETLAKAYPGLVRRLPTKGEVLDRVRASPCAPGSPYLEGVFGRDVTPIYTLEGAYLIEVLNPERVEVLVDSAESAQRWGGGNLAAWARAGHGVMLDSVNHFDLQGLERAEGLRKPIDRQAFAIDHMGITYAELRLIQGEKLWSKSQAAAKIVKDLSVIRLVTNFVRLKRLLDE